MRRLMIAAVTLLVIAGWSTRCGAEKGSVAIAAGIGMRGVGGEVILGVGETLNLRGGLSGFKYSYSGTEDDVKYDFDLGLLTASALVDWHMLHGGFRLTGGFMLNKNKLDAVAEPSATFDIGDQTYTVDDVGTLTGRIDFNDVAAYGGIGWGNPVGQDKKWGIAVDLGAMFQGSANVKMNTTGRLSSDSGFQNDLRKEEANLQDDLKPFKYYPVLSIAITYRVQ